MAKDRFGNPIPASQILAEPLGTRALVAGLAGEPTYLTLQEDDASNTQINERGIVDNCTHLGCTFPWNPAENKSFSAPATGLFTIQKALLFGGLRPCL